jgi:hypothetical protein
MKIKFVIILSIISTMIFANNLRISGDNAEYKISGDFFIENTSVKQVRDTEYIRIEAKNTGITGEEGLPELPVHTQLVALPATGNLSVKSFTYDFEIAELSQKIVPCGWEDNHEPDNEFYSRNQWYPKELVQIASPSIMRGNRFTQVALAVVQYNPVLNKTRTLKNIDLQLEVDYSNTDNPLLQTNRISSETFSKLIETKIYDAAPARSQEKGSYLFIAPDALVTNLQYLARWKEKLGYKTKIATISETGNTNSEINDYIQNAYDTWDVPPEFVILVGDVSGQLIVPTFYIPGGWGNYDVTDFQYSLCEGDDYFPDVMLGRISIQSPTELLTVISKIINYEKNPYMEEDWFDHALMISYILDDGYWHIYSHRETVMAVREKLLDYTYTVVDTFVHPWNSGQNNLANKINDGHSIINLRATGSHDHWVTWYGVEIFGINNVNQLSNGFKLPFVASMTCGGGDFGAGQEPSNFGETWLIAGTPSIPKGAIAFVGPSEYDTQTGWNNANDIGIFQGFTQYGVTKAAELMLSGKMALYNNYPFAHEMGNAHDSDQFYFYVYGLLGDPGVSIWSETPKSVSLEISTEISSGSNYLEASVNIAENDRSGFTIAITNADSLVTYGITNNSGTALIPIKLNPGDYEVTASKYGYIPVSEDLVSVETDMISMYDFDFSEEVTPGSVIDLEISVKNMGELTAENIDVLLISDDEYLTVTSDVVNADNMNPNETADLMLQFAVGNTWLNFSEKELFVQISSSLGNNIFLVPVVIQAPETVFYDMSSILLQGETTEVELDLFNAGNTETGDFSVTLISMNDKADVTSGTGNFDNIEPGEAGTSTNAFTIDISADVITGETAVFQAEIIQNAEVVQTLTFEVPIGDVRETSPTFCDYGYYAVESADEGNFTAPVYDWIEIDPSNGGPGTETGADHSTFDGWTKVLDLPFTFQYFGRFYDQISVSSNGWISMGETELVFFRNRNIPDGTGPRAMIAPFWDEIREGNTFVYYDETEHYYVIEWSECVDAYNNFYEVTFEVILFDPAYYPTATGDGEILFQYKNVYSNDQENNYCTVGIENYEQTEGLLMTFADIYPETVHELEDETAILFTIREGNPVPLLTVEPDEINISIPAESNESVALTLINNGSINDLEFAISVSNFGRDEANRDISNDQIIRGINGYVPVIPFDLSFYLIHNSPDNEPIHGVTLDFPEGFHVNNATSINTMLFNGQSGDGVTCSWGFGSGADYVGSNPQIFTVNVTIDADQTETVVVDWYIEGDGSGAEPHTRSGNLIIDPTTNDYLWLEYPNGGETLVYGIQDSITWNSYGNDNLINIELSRDNGMNWEPVSTNEANDGFFDFVPSGSLSDECKIKLSSPGGPMDISDATFNISALEISYPTIGTVMQYGTLEAVVWSGTGGIENVDIEISLDNGFSWDYLGQDEENDGLYEFYVPGPPSNDCKIRLSNSDDASVFNLSSNFAITDFPVEWIIPETAGGVIAPGENTEIQILFDTHDLEEGSYQAFIEIATNWGQETIVPVFLQVTSASADNDIVTAPKLMQNYPNPFNPNTTIAFKISRQNAKDAELEIFNIKGQKVKTFSNLQNYESGNQQIEWNGTDEDDKSVASGLYFYKLKTDNKIIDTKKMLLLK